MQVDKLEALIAEHKPKFVYLIPTFGNPSGAMLSLERRKKVLELAVKYQTLIVRPEVRKKASRETRKPWRRSRPRSGVSARLSRR